MELDTAKTQAELLRAAEMNGQGISIETVARVLEVGKQHAQTVVKELKLLGETIPPITNYKPNMNMILGLQRWARRQAEGKQLPLRTASELTLPFGMPVKPPPVCPDGEGVPVFDDKITAHLIGPIWEDGELVYKVMFGRIVK